MNYLIYSIHSLKFTLSSLIATDVMSVLCRDADSASSIGIALSSDCKGRLGHRYFNPETMIWLDSYTQ